MHAHALLHGQFKAYTPNAESAEMVAMILTGPLRWLLKLTNFIGTQYTLEGVYTQYIRYIRQDAIPRNLRRA